MTVADPDLAPGNVRVKVKATTVCGSGIRYPSIQWHEFAGFSANQRAEIDVNAIDYNEVMAVGASGLADVTAAFAAAEQRPAIKVAIIGE